ncbi:MAG: TolB family protein [Gammaproteobacteria bacterium]
MKKLQYILTISSLFIFALFITSISASEESALTWLQPTPADYASANAHISVNGRFVAFHSAATNLVPNDTNNRQDIFVYDRESKIMERVSIHSDGSEANHYSLNPSISRNGRYVTFMSSAENLVDNDANGQIDIFVRDRQEKTTSLVSVSIEGNSGNTRSLHPVISANGRYIAFESAAKNLIKDDINESSDVFVRDLVEKTTELISLTSRDQQANHSSHNPSISSDGRYVVFHSPARNLVPVDNKRSDENEWNFSDVFIRDRELGKTEIISLNTLGQPGNHPSHSGSVSTDGRFVAFASMSSDLVENYPDTALEITGKGRTARRIDIFVRDRKNKTTQLASIGKEGAPGNHQSQSPKISSNGRYVTFQSAASNLTEFRVPGSLINIYRRDLQEGKTMLVTNYYGPKEGNIMAAHSAVSEDGSFVVFDTNYGHSGAELARESDVYVWNASNGKLELVSFENLNINHTD